MTIARTIRETPGASVPVRLETLGVLLFGQQQERRRVRILKSDTQGYEPFVLRGAERFIARDASTILLEYWPSGYAPARADGVGMLRTLRVWYPHAYVIEGDALHRSIPLLSTIF